MDTSLLPDIASKLFPNFWTWIVQLCSTGILLFFFKKYLWKPVLAYFEKRADFIEKNINDSKEMREKAQAYLNEADLQAKETAKQYRDILDRAKDDANREKQDIIQDANNKAKQKIEQARSEIESEKQQAQEEMKTEIVDLASELASKIMDKEIDKEANDKLITEFINGVNQ